MVALKIKKIGNSKGVVLPKEELERLRLDEGDTLFLTHSVDGARLTPYDPDFEIQMKAARTIMKRRRNALRELAR